MRSGSSFEERVWDCSGLNRQDVEFCVKKWQDMDMKERMRLNQKQRAYALIQSKYRELERQLVRKYSGCAARTQGRCSGCYLVFDQDSLSIVDLSQTADQHGKHFSEAPVEVLVAVAHLADELTHRLEEALAHLPNGYEEAVASLTSQVDKLRGLSVEEISTSNDE